MLPKPIAEGDGSAELISDPLKHKSAEFPQRKLRKFPAVIGGHILPLREMKHNNTIVLESPDLSNTHCSVNRLTRNRVSRNIHFDHQIRRWLLARIQRVAGGNTPV